MNLRYYITATSATLCFLLKYFAFFGRFSFGSIQFLTQSEAKRKPDLPIGFRSVRFFRCFAELSVVQQELPIITRKLDTQSLFQSRTKRTAYSFSPYTYILESNVLLCA